MKTVKMSFWRTSVLCLFFILNINSIFSQNNDDKKKNNDDEEQRDDSFITSMTIQSTSIQDSIYYYDDEIELNTQKSEILSNMLLTIKNLQLKITALKEEE